MKKKICTTLSICIVAMLMLFVASRIFAKTTETGGETKSIAWGVYEVSEDKEEVYQKVEGSSDSTKKDYGYNDLDGSYFVFCIEHGVALPTIGKEKEIKEMASLSTKAYHDGSVVAHAETSITSTEAKQVGSGMKAIETRNYNGYNQQYYSRRLDATNAKMTIKATENVDSSWAGGAISGRLDWDLAYILAQTKTSYTYEKNPAQLALWKALGYSDVEAGGEDIYKEAQAFKEYRENYGEPNIDTQREDDFEYKLEDSELIVGPIVVNYKTVQEMDDGTELEVGEVIEDSCKLYGIDKNGNEVLIEREHYRFVDADGNETAENYPAEGEETYIQIPYDDPIYSTIKYISRYEMSIKQLDVRAAVYEISGAKTVYRKWDPKNIIYVDCRYRIFQGYDFYGNPQYSYGSCVHPKGNCTKPSNAVVMSETINQSESYSILKKGTEITQDAQNLFVLRAAEMLWRKFDLVVEFEPPEVPDEPDWPDWPTPTPDTPTPTPTPPPDEPLVTYIDLGGIVWLDEPENKETEPNGELDENHEKGIKNVRVTLYFADGTKVTGGSSSKGKVPVRQDFKNDIYTDGNGRYEFKDLPMTEQYYVEFTYDGVTYEPTKAFAKGSASGYLSDPNNEIYKRVSKAEEDEDERKEFNKKFEQIIGLGYSSLQNGITKGRTGTGIDIQYNTFTKDNRNISEYKKLEEYIEKKEETEKIFEDLGMKAYTKQKSAETVVFPIKTDFTIWSVDNNINNAKNELGYLKYINLGLKERPKADFALNTQIKAGGMTIKDKEKVVFYKTNVKDEDLNIDGTVPTDEYIKQEIAATDYYWKRDVKDKLGYENLGFTIVQDHLDVYVLYRIVVQNQCEVDGMYGIITELVDYYDNRLELVPPEEKQKVSELFTAYGFEVPKGKVSWIDGTTTEVEWEPDTGVGKYNAIKTKGLELKVDENGDKKSTSAVYLILKVGKNGDILHGNEELGDDPIENIAEISSYKTYLKGGEIAGTVDCDSAPKNATPGKKETYEDDTDAAPMFSLKINWTPRLISGNVWDDTENIDGKKNNPGIENVKVELIEYIPDENGQISADRCITRPGLILDEANHEIRVADKNDEKRTDGSGNYDFYVEGGNYGIKFIYGDTDMLYGEHANKKYNAQDYQATTYTALSSMPNYGTVYKLENKQVLDGEHEVTISESGDTDQVEQETAKWGGADNSNIYSNARDLATIRAKLINSAMTLNYANGNKLHDLNPGEGKNDKEVRDKDTALTLSGDNDKNDINYTYMESVTDIVTISANDVVKQEKIINLGLKERPKAGLELKKEAVRTQLISNDGKVLIDTDDMRKLQNYSSWKDEIMNNEEALMYIEDRAIEGAVVKITYKLTVENTGKIDNINNYIYVEDDEKIILPAIETKYKENFGEQPDRYKTLETKADFIYDYVNINLEFRQDDNKVTDQDGKVAENETKFAWKKVYDNRDANVNDKEIEGTISNEVLAQIPLEVRKVSKVIKTTDDANNNTGLEPGATTSVYLDLSIALAENIETDNGSDYVYSNAAEIVQTSTGAGRRDDKVVNGNNVPYADEPGDEPDFSETGRIIVIPPTGQQRYYYVLVAIGAIMMIGGVILIKKKVLGKNK